MELLNQIRAVVGDAGLITGEEVAIRPGDWRGRTSCSAWAVVRPRTTAEFSEVMKLCYAARQPVVPAGGLTGLVRGHAVDANELQLSFERMRNIQSIDPVGRTMIVEAGVPLQAVQEAAAEHGLLYGVDLSARGSCTIGGNISTNAGGNTVIRYGMTRENVLGLEAVLADGTVVSSMSSLLKNNTGYDLKQLFIGSEGTLGLVTRAVLRLHPAPISEATAIVAFDSFEKLTQFLLLAGSRLGGMIRSFEVMWNNFYEIIGVRSGRHRPPLAAGHEVYVIVEVAGTDIERDEAIFQDVLTVALEKGIAADAVVAASKSQRDAIWAIREDVEGEIIMMDPATDFDVSLPIVQMQEYVRELQNSLRTEFGEDALMTVYGHVGDNNLHLLVSPRPWSDEAKRRVQEMVYRPLAVLGGSVSAEHGIGLSKREWLPLSRGAEELALMRRIKAALDPHNLLNRGKILAR
ncbi:FAD-binding oxidoreductase [Bradyrhizobium sp. WSM 1738]|uniref:FAD-binding oxidoreductase n=1 Tax=Bradyrhizobium hereditatis TaxID=2821405 RepID=UPI001CE23E38|nr:FAD-binding oxidoreductase [Bradyrhizobium hereditatis]MCA6120178.1 FAD-binding oxidoreductase [Bradyrhizobium hereditatis]